MSPPPPPFPAVIGQYFLTCQEKKQNRFLFKPPSVISKRSSDVDEANLSEMTFFSTENVINGGGEKITDMEWPRVSPI